MNDYIKREDAITAYCEHECGIKGMTRENCGATDCGTIFDDIPTADVRENVRGEWVFPYEDKKYKRCSACGKTFYSIPATSNYCPNCGADMRSKS